MTFSVLIYALMVSSLAAIVGALVADTVRGGSREPAARRVADRGLRPAPGRLVHRGDCPRKVRATAATAARARRGGTPRSCRR
jgi:hypothetical protein